MIISTSITQNKEIISKEFVEQFSERITINQNRLDTFFDSLINFATNWQKIQKSHHHLAAPGMYRTACLIATNWVITPSSEDLVRGGIYNSLYLHPRDTLIRTGFKMVLDL